MNKMKVSNADDLYEQLIVDFASSQKMQVILVRQGNITREEFIKMVREHIQQSYYTDPQMAEDALKMFDQYVFGYSRLTPLIDDPDISDIHCLAYNNIRIKKKGKRMESDVCFPNEKAFQNFIEMVATKNQVNISNLNAIQRFTDTDTHPQFILRFTLTMPIVNTFNHPYLTIRKVPKNFPEIADLIHEGMLSQETANLLIDRFRTGSTLICGGNSAGKTTLLNALKETLPESMSVIVTQQADELTTKSHPDMFFLHSLSDSAESKVRYSLKEISEAALTFDVDFIVIGEVKSEEALYLLNAAYSGQLCAASAHGHSARTVADKLVDYSLHAKGNKYTPKELLKMMSCFKTIVYVKGYRVQQVEAVEGWDEENQEILYQTLYKREGKK